MVCRWSPSAGPEGYPAEDSDSSEEEEREEGCWSPDLEEQHTIEGGMREGSSNKKRRRVDGEEEGIEAKDHGGTVVFPTASNSGQPNGGNMSSEVHRTEEMPQDDATVQSLEEAPEEAPEDAQMLSLCNERFLVPEVLFRPQDIGLKQGGESDDVHTCQALCHAQKTRSTVAQMLIGNIGPSIETCRSCRVCTASPFC